MNAETKAFIADLVTALDWSSWVTAIATLTLAGLTFVYVVLTRRISDHQSDPCVIVSVVHDEDRSSILQLVVKNVGTGVAYDIRFNFSRPLPLNAWGVSLDGAEGSETMTSGPLIDGIPALGPGETRKTDWGQYGGLMKALAEGPIIAICSFRKANKTMPPTRNILEVASFIGTVAAETPVARIAHTLERMERDTKAISKSLGRIQRRYTAAADDGHRNIHNEA